MFPVSNRFGAVWRFSEPKFWFLFLFTGGLLVLDFVTTTIILECLGGIELNPLVNSIGLFNITIYKLAANAFVGIVSFQKRFLWLLCGLSVVFSGVVTWNILNIVFAL